MMRRWRTSFGHDTGHATTMEAMSLLMPLLLFAVSVTPDLDARLAKWKPVKMPYDPSGLTPAERKVVDKLVEASRYMESIYWRQNDPEALELYKTTKNPKLKRFLMINGCRFDLIDENKPFV